MSVSSNIRPVPHPLREATFPVWMLNHHGIDLAHTKLLLCSLGPSLKISHCWKLNKWITWDDNQWKTHGIRSHCLTCRACRRRDIYKNASSLSPHFMFRVWRNKTFIWPLGSIRPLSPHLRVSPQQPGYESHAALQPHLLYFPPQPLNRHPTQADVIKARAG